MPPIQRITVLDGITDLMETYLVHLNHGVATNNKARFTLSISGIEAQHEQLLALSKDTERASTGYLNNPKARRALHHAAREVGLLADRTGYLVTSIRDLLPESTNNDLTMIALEMMEICRGLRKITFAPGIPVMRLDRKAIIAQAQTEESSIATERAYNGLSRKEQLEARIASREPKKYDSIFEAKTAKEILNEVNQRKALKESPDSIVNKTVDGHSTTLAPLTEERPTTQDAPLKADEHKALNELFGG